MFYKVLGILAIIIAIVASVIGIVPGAMSVLATYLMLIALIFSIIAVAFGCDTYFKGTAIIVAVGLLILNDGVRLYGSLPQVSWLYKALVYSVYLTICVPVVYSIRKRQCSSEEVS